MIRMPQGSFAVMLCLCSIVLSISCCILAGCLASSDKLEKQAVEVDATLLDFGETEDKMYFNVIFTEGETEWEIVSEKLPSWCKTDIERESKGARVTVVVDRASLSPGEYFAFIPVKWGSGSQTVKVRVIIPEAGNETGTIIIDNPLPEKEVLRK